MLCGDGGWRLASATAAPGVEAPFEFDVKSRLEVLDIGSRPGRNRYGSRGAEEKTDGEQRSVVRMHIHLFSWKKWTCRGLSWI